MLPELALTFGSTALVFAIGFVLARRVPRDQPLLSVPRWLATLVLGLALMAPYMLYWRGLLTVPVINDLVGALALSLAGWLLAIRLVGLEHGASC